jgi:hypothetical protein
MQEEIICPYPGLRPFNEEESIFFKGREEHIDQIVRQLEEKKFLMLTGASGDGKSSLVYAGVIPHARAGFFKAKFNNWVVADFRPEREPLKNMAIAIDTQLQVNDVERTAKELSYGFSSLIDIYKASGFWVDQQSDAYLKSNADEQKKAKRKGANLLILVDQFEEFFTNPENYSAGKASIESQAVINSLLETTRLALEQDLPIYIVCTMRSDYIGQCASFRGLPEYIGYSQFFVPRLKRKEIYQVIEEPALLNGNKISKRLIEMLINEMSDGIDQLPVLQHALNQIWQKAERGKVEMDIIHFAKINGIPKNHLNKQDKLEFEEWFDKLPEFKKEFFKQSSLGDVLDAHANELFETANDLIGDKISEEDAKLIVETAFKCLTKIDEARAVRNRMTLDEVTRIINKPHITPELVDRVLYVFRIQGNTFLKPFIFGDSTQKDLSGSSVLDITHESLIRNWQKLTVWAQEEYENLLTWQDFNKQLQRYVNSNKSSGYLLPIGPLTFFETWFNTAKPNEHWLARYDDREISKEQKLIDARKTLDDANNFIKRSTRRLFFSRTVLKYGANKIIAVLGVVLFVFSCTYFFFDFRKKQNKYVLADIQKKGDDLLRSKYIKSKPKADYIMTSERLNPGTFQTLLGKIEEDSVRLEVNREMTVKALEFGKMENEKDNPLLAPLFLNQIELINSRKDFMLKGNFVKNINEIMALVYEKILIHEAEYDSVLIKAHAPYARFSERAFNSFIDLIQDTSLLSKIDITQFIKIFQTIPEIANYDSLKLKKVIDLIDPFEEKSSGIFNLVFAKNKTIKFDYQNTITHNGGYYQMANYFALLGDFDKLNRSLDSVTVNNKNFMNSIYSSQRFIYNLIINDKLYTKDGQLFMDKLSDKLINKETFPVTILVQDALISYKQDISTWDISNLFQRNDWSTAFEFQTQRNKITYSQVGRFVDFNIKKNNEKTTAADERNFMNAILYKAKAYCINKPKKPDQKLVNENITTALNNYKKVSDKYLSEDITIGARGNTTLIKRSDFFKYPISIPLTQNWDPFSFHNLTSARFCSLFLKTIEKNNDLDKFYFKTDEDITQLNKFLFYYSIIIINSLDQNKDHGLDIIDKVLGNKELVSNKKLNVDYLNTALAVYNFKLNREKEAMELAGKVDAKKLLDKERLTELGNNTDYYYDNIINQFLAFYAQNDELIYKDEEGERENDLKVFKFIENASMGYKKRNIFLVCIDSLQTGRRMKDDIVMTMMDSLVNGYISKKPRFGNKLFELLGRISTNGCDELAMKLMKDKSDKTKPACLNFFVRGIAFSGNYYKALNFIPEYISSASQLSLYTTILGNEVIVRNKKRSRYDLATNWEDSPYENGESSENFFYMGE